MRMSPSGIRWAWARNSSPLLHFGGRPFVPGPRVAVASSPRAGLTASSPCKSSARNRAVTELYVANATTYSYPTIWRVCLGRSNDADRQHARQICMRSSTCRSAVIHKYLLLKGIWRFCHGGRLSSILDTPGRNAPSSLDLRQDSCRPGLTRPLTAHARRAHGGSSASRGFRDVRASCFRT